MLPNASNLPGSGWRVLSLKLKHAEDGAETGDEEEKEILASIQEEAGVQRPQGS